MTDGSTHCPIVSVAALGCKLSQAEGNTIAERLLEAGFAVKPFGEPADVAIVHTCTVTETAGAKSRKLLSKARRSAGMVIAAGCHAVLDGEELLGAGLADHIVRHEDESQLATIVCELLGISPVIIAAVPLQSELIGKDKRLERTRAFLPIQTGCDRDCTFCRIRLARGKSASLSGVEVERLIAKKIAQDYHEVVLAGVDLADWHDDERDLVDLLAQILPNLPEDSRLRLSSLEPDAGLIHKIADLMLDYPRSLARHLHVPLQSGSDSILSAMGRDYTAGDYRRLLQDVTDKVTDLCWGADVLAGFPGETEADFALTYDLLESLPVAYLHVFPFSPRKGTAAADLPHRIPSKTIQERVSRLRQLSQEKWKQFRQAQIGSSACVLVEGKPEAGRGVWGGRAGNYVHVWGEGLEQMQNRWAVMRLQELYGNGLWGVVEKSD